MGGMKDRSSWTDQTWSVHPAATAGVRWFRADDPAQPQPKRDGHRQGHPTTHLLALGVQLVGLDMLQVQRSVVGERVMNGAGGASSLGLPGGGGVFSSPKAATMAGSGQPWASRVRTTTNKA
jgi:hypothetical protein